MGAQASQGQRAALSGRGVRFRLCSRQTRRPKVALLCIRPCCWSGRPALARRQSPPGQTLLCLSSEGSRGQEGWAWSRFLGSSCAHPGGSPGPAPLPAAGTASHSSPTHTRYCKHPWSPAAVRPGPFQRPTRSPGMRAGRKAALPSPGKLSARRTGTLSFIWMFSGRAAGSRSVWATFILPVLPGPWGSWSDSCPLRTKPHTGTTWGLGTAQGRPTGLSSFPDRFFNLQYCTWVLNETQVSFKTWGKAPSPPATTPHGGFSQHP